MNRMDQTAQQPEEAVVSFLPQLASSLQAGLDQIEPRFEDLGQNLQAVYGDSEELTKGIMASADSMTEGGQDSLLHYVGKMVNDSLSVLSGYRQTISGSLENINAGTGYLAQLCAICERMKKSSYFLNIVGLNISVEGSRSRDALDMFGDFGQEIKGLAGKIGKISATIHDDSKKVQADQLAVFRDITEGMKTFDELSESTKNAVQLAREKMESISRLASKTLETAGSHAREISGIVGEIVMSIQFHDIARQQVEHIISALGDVSSQWDASNGGVQAPETEKKGRAYRILTLQTAQLKQVKAEAQRVHETMEDAFGRLGAKVDLLMENVGASRSDYLGGESLEQGVRQFQQDLEKLSQILAKGQELEARISKTMEDSSQAVSTLSQYTDQVSNINIDLQYKAINAIIMTSKLGDKGATLEVLARNVRDLSNDSNTLVKEVLEVIASITGLAGLSGPDPSGQKEDAGHSDSLETSMDKGISRISNAYEQYKHHCDTSENMSARIVESIETTRVKLDFIPEWIRGSAQVLESLETLLGTLEPWKEMAQNLPADTEDEIAQRYTMESERRIHEQFTGAGEDMEGEPVEEAGDQDPSSDHQEDGLDDNIELF